MVDLSETTGVLQLFSDPTRVRLTALLAERELTVAEMVAVTQLGQSRVSTHLGRLREAGVLRDRRAGASTFYRLSDSMPPHALRLWELLRGQVSDQVLESDRARCEQVLREREGAGWPDAVAGQMERHYSPGRTWESLARGFLGLVRAGDVLDLGSGDGTVAELLAPRCRTITLLDRSDKLLAAARRRLGERDGIAFRRGDVHELPFDDASFDSVLALNVLQYADDPPRALGEAARVLRPGGDVTIVTLAAHDHQAITDRYGHVNPGFEPEALAGILAGAGLEVDRCEVTSRERRSPHFRVVTAFARKSSPGRKP